MASEQLPDLTARRRALADLLVERDLPAALVTRLVNVRYLTGFTGSNAALYLTAEGAGVLATDGRYGDQAATECPGVEILVERTLLPALTGRAASDGVGRIGLETHVLTVDAYDTMRREQPELERVSLESAVEKLRVHKDESELAALREACAISAKALESLWAETELEGRTEREIALDLEVRMSEQGGDGPAFSTIVAAGEHSAIPHHHPTDRVVQAGDLLKIDFGALYQGYHADCTRTVVVGRPPADWQRELYDVVREAQRAGRHALAPGAELAAVDGAAREVITDAGFGDRFTHGLGHGVGLEIHEDPFFAKTATGKLSGCTPVTVEPGVYLSGRGGVRIEDTLVVHEAAQAEPELLTTTTKDLLVLS